MEIKKPPINPTYNHEQAKIFPNNCSLGNIDAFKDGLIDPDHAQCLQEHLKLIRVPCLKHKDSYHWITVITDEALSQKE